MLIAPLIAFCVVAIFASAGILDSFSRGLQAAAIHNMNRPTPKPSHPTEQPTVNNLVSNWQQQMNSSSTFMPTLSGGQQRVDLCEGNILVPLTDVKKELTFKSNQFPFKRSVPLLCSWNVKVDNKCRRGLVTMVINERSRLSGERRCTKGYYRVSPFMKEAKICGRINMVPAFQWYVEDQQPENVTITLKHNGLNDGYSEGLGFTLTGECLTEASDMTTSKAIKSYSNWLHQLSKSQSAETGSLTVVLPFVSLDSVPLEGSIVKDTTHLADESDPPAAMQSLQNLTESHTWSAEYSTNTPITVSEAFEDSSNQTLAVTLVTTNVTVPVNLTTTFNNATEISMEVAQSTRPTGQSSSENDRDGPNYAIDFKVPEDDSETPWLIVESLKPDPSLLNVYPAAIRRRQPITKRPAGQVSHGNNPDIPWLILKSPKPNPTVPTNRSPATRYRPPTPVPVRRPLPPTARPAAHHWPIRNPAEINNRLSSFLRPQRPKVSVRQVRPTTSVDNQGIPWLILKSPDVSPSSVEIYYPQSPSNELSDVSNEDENDHFSGYFFPKT